MTMENGDDRRILTQMDEQVAQIKDNWQDATGDHTCAHMSQTVQKGRQLSMKKETILALCKTIADTCKTVAGADGKSSPQGRALKLEKRL